MEAWGQQHANSLLKTSNMSINRIFQLKEALRSAYMVVAAIVGNPL